MINVNDLTFYKPFEELKNGEVFYTEASGTIWMKLREDEFLYNSAVSLDDGTVCAFGDEENVIKVNLECKVIFGKPIDN